MILLERKAWEFYRVSIEGEWSLRDADGHDRRRGRIGLGLGIFKMLKKRRLTTVL